MTYKVILADPPWNFQTRSPKGLGRSAQAHYDCMSMEELEALAPQIMELADPESCAMCMWVTDPLLPQALSLIKTFGFVYKTVLFTWVKLNPVAADENIDAARGTIVARVSASLPHQGKNAFHMGTGYYTRCLRGDARVFIMDAITKRVEYLPLREVWLRRETTMFIHTHRGWRLINDMARNEAMPVREVHTSLAPPIACSGDHRWAVKLPSPHRIEWVTLNDAMHRKAFEPRNGVNLSFSTTPMESQATLTAYNGFDLTDDIAWMIGLFIAEGSSARDSHSNQVRFSLHKDEIQLYERVRDIVDGMAIPADRFFRKSVKVYMHQIKSKNSMAVYFASKRIKALIDGFVAGIGAKGKRLNLDRLWQTSASFRRSLLKGVLDGDGTKLKMNYPGYEGYQVLSLANEGLITDLRELCMSIGVPTRARRQDFSTSPAGTVTTHNTFYFASPRCKGLQLDGVDVVPAEIKSAKEVEVAVTYDLSVTDEAFVVEGLISHNSNPEMCLLATRGKRAPKTQDRGVRQLLVAPRGQHSQKPAEARRRIERLFSGPYYELFARSTAPGWSCDGNQVGLLDNGKVDTRRWPSAGPGVGTATCSQSTE